MLHVENTKNLLNNNFGVLGHIKAHYGCYEIIKNGGLHIHTLLWLNDFLDPNHLYEYCMMTRFFNKN
jgi:hypothetical protein